MYNELLNKRVVVLVCPRTENFLEYSGLLISESDESVMLKNVSINMSLLSFQKNIFGGNMGNYKNELETVIINKRYIMSINNN